MKTSHPISILMAGGGTGGHLWPGVALADALQVLEPEAKIFFFVPGRPVDISILQTKNYPFYINPMRPIPRRDKLLQFFCKFSQGFRMTMSLFRHCLPDIVVGLGGYGAFSSGILAHLQDIPLVMIESNRVGGKVVRWLANFSEAVYSGGEIKGVRKEKIKLLGIPLRDSLLKNREIFKAKKEKLTVLIMGGSQGARCINEALMESLKHMQKIQNQICFIHLAGKGLAENADRLYKENGFEAEVYGFYPRMSELYKKSDVIICRAGGSTIAEISAIGLPSVLVPFARAAEDHQTANAICMQKNNASIVIKEKELNGQKIANLIENFVKNPKNLSEMAQRAKSLGKPEAAMDIARDILKIYKANKVA